MSLVSKQPRKPSTRRWNFAEWFILSQTVFPALLYLPHTQPLRVPIRMAAYGISLGALIYYWFLAPSRSWVLSRLHPAALWLAVAIFYLGLMLLHPNTNTFLAGLAQICMYMAVLAPLLWAPACVEEPAHLQRLLWLILICSGINSFVGVMQVYDPNTWMPQEFSSVVMESEMGLGTVIYEGANGNLIIRPPGLGDAPGAVCGPAVFALYLGLVFAASESKWWKRIVAIVFAGLGAQAIFLSLVRSSFLIALGMIVLFFLVQLGRGKVAQAAVLIVVTALALLFAFRQSSQTGGSTLVDRFMTIIEGNPIDFYYENRGNQVASGFSELLPKYPLGAGLGRWGMMNNYFGDPSSGTSPPIWVEIQWLAWIVDGGVVLLLLYPIALGVAMWRLTLTTFRHADKDCQRLASIILAANSGLLALCFSYPIFLSPTGVLFWFLTGAMHGVSRKQGLARQALRRAEMQLPRPAASAVGLLR